MSEALLPPRVRGSRDSRYHVSERICSLWSSPGYLNGRLQLGGDEELVLGWRRGVWVVGTCPKGQVDKGLLLTYLLEASKGRPLSDGMLGCGVR